MSTSNLQNLLTKDVIVKVSSNMDTNSKKKYLLDGSNETCWSSAQGLPQSISLVLPSLLPATHFSITFQGGFSGTTMALYIATQRPGPQVDEIPLGMVYAGRVYGKDSNARQVFEIGHIRIQLPEAVDSPTSTANGIGSPEKEHIKELKIEFEKSADPWGRIVVYDLQLLG